MGYGWTNPWPFAWGGGTRAAERVWRTLRGALGHTGHGLPVAGDEDTSIEDAWRQAKARAIGAIATFSERAARQVTPHSATDLLPYYEEALRLFPSPDDTLVERRAAAAAKFTSLGENDEPSLADALQALDARLTLIAENHDIATVSHPGSFMEPRDGTEPYSTLQLRTASDFAFYASAYRVTVLFDLGGALPTVRERQIMERARALLADMLPAWMECQVVTSVGFLTGVSPLTITGT